MYIHMEFNVYYQLEAVSVRISFSPWMKSHNSEGYGQPSGWLYNIQHGFVLRFFPFLLLQDEGSEQLSFIILSGNQRN